MHKDNFITIAGYPDYLLNPDTLEVISFHYSRNGRLRALEWNTNTDEMGYRLYNNGKVRFFSLKDLQGTVEIHNIKNSLKEKQKMAQIKARVPKKGDFIVGSISKTNGELSFSAIPGCHDTWTLANKEAERLAERIIDKKFIVVEVKGIVSMQQVVWEH